LCSILSDSEDTYSNSPSNPFNAVAMVPHA
jgi:hypothetical protein